MKQSARYFVALSALLWVAMAVFSWHLLLSFEPKPASESVQQGVYVLKNNDLGVASLQQRQNTNHFSGQKQPQSLLWGAFTESDTKTAVSENYLTYAQYIVVGLSVEDMLFPAHFFL